MLELGELEEREREEANLKARQGCQEAWFYVSQAIFLCLVVTS